MTFPRALSRTETQTVSTGFELRSPVSFHMLIKFTLCLLKEDLVSFYYSSLACQLVVFLIKAECIIPSDPVTKVFIIIYIHFHQHVYLSLKVREKVPT